MVCNPATWGAQKQQHVCGVCAAWHLLSQGLAGWVVMTFEGGNFFRSPLASVHCWEKAPLMVFHRRYIDSQVQKKISAPEHEGADEYSYDSVTAFVRWWFSILPNCRLSCCRGSLSATHKFAVVLFCRTETYLTIFLEPSKSFPWNFPVIWVRQLPFE